MRGVVLPALAGLLFAAALAVGLRPEAGDLWPRDRTGLEAPDDGYWSAPARRLAGAGDQDDYDHDLALALALPQNALAAAAVGLGVPYPHARHAGSLLAAAALAAVALAWLSGRARAAGAVLTAALLSPPVLGHLASDLGEGPALGITAAWAVAALSRRFALAGAVAALALSQKAWGLPLGVGTLVGALSEAGRRRAAVSRAACGVAAGLAVSTGVAVVVFGDDPFAFLLRPFAATGDTGAGARGLGALVQAVFAGAHGVGDHWLPASLAATAAATLAPARRPSPAVLAAAAAGLLFAGAFPDPWRVLPVLPLLAATLVEDRVPAATRATPPRDAREARGGAGRWLAAAPLAIALPQAVGGVALAVGTPRLLPLGAATLAVGALLGLAVRRLRPRPLLAAAVGLACAVAAAGTAARTAALRGTERRALAAEVAGRLPRDAHLVGYSFLATSFAGRLYYPPFAPMWEGELARRAPPVLFRLRVPSPDAGAPPGPAGYRVVRSDDLGVRPYNRELRARPLVLDTLEPPPVPPR